MNTIISNRLVSAEINPMGAELINLKKGTKNYIWSINEAYWNKTSPVLFPIVGRLKEDTYKIDNQKYHLPRHGFARNFKFIVIDKTENSVTFSLSESHQTLALYPFRFNLVIKYEITETKLLISYIVINNSTEQMPFSIGAHPAFSIDLSFNNYAIQFKNDTILTTSELENEQFSGKTSEIVLKNNTLPLSYSLFEKDALVFKSFQSRKILLLENHKPYLAIDLGNFPHLGIWTKPNAPFLCIEPWQGYADNSNTDSFIFNKEGIITLNPKEEYSNTFSIEIL